ncbi:hypothetical protein ABZ800_25745 [Streptomyces sp. NPDC047813]|uniref:hypothetical protein n=1 Tax=Streptomyces sp. NPDC047813 TaxID=3154608 RepID=UPI0033F97404
MLSSQAVHVFIGTPRQNVGNAALAILGSAATALLVVRAERDRQSKGNTALWTLLAASVITCLADAGARMLIGLQADPGANSLVMYRAFGIEMAVWMAFAFPPYVGIIGYSTYLVFREKRHRRSLWLILVVSALADTGGEYVMMHGGHLYSYVGRQPLKVVGLPLVWPWVIVAAPMLMGALVALFDTSLRGARRLLLLPLLGSGYLACLAAVGWPGMVARATALGQTALDVTGLVTLGGLLATVYVMSLPLPAHTAAPHPAQKPAAGGASPDPAGPGRG